MTLPAVINKLEDVAEAFRSEYKQGEGGKYYLDVSGVDDMPAVSGLKKAKQDLLDEKKALKQKLDAYGDVTPEKIKELQEAAKGSGKEGQKIQELEQKLEQQSKQAQLEIQQAKEEAAKATAAAETYFKRSEIQRAVKAAKGEPALLEHEIMKSLQVKRLENGEFSLVVIGRDGQARIKDSQANPFTIDDLVNELKTNPTFGRAFDGLGKSGSGADPNAGGGGSGGAGSVKVQDGVVKVDPAALLEGKVNITT